MGRDDESQGWVILILLGALAVSVNLISFGLGFVNLVSGEIAPPPPPTEQAPAAQAIVKRRAAPNLGPDLAHARTQLARMRADEAELRAEVERKRAAAPQPPVLPDPNVERKETEALKDRIAELERQERNLERQIAEKQAVSASALFPGGRSAKQPQWVECLDRTVVLQPQGQRFTHDDLKNRAAAFTSAITTGYVVFLVRPSGFDVFYTARRVATNAKLTIGYEPVDAGWKLRF